MPFFSLVREAACNTRITFSTDDRSLKSHEVKMTFTDGRVGIFDKEQIGQLTYFKNKDLDSSSFQFEFSLETFFKVLEISIGKKMFREVADLDDPFVVENMEKALVFFTSKEETKQILLHFQKAELPVWSFESALRVAEAYRKSSPLNGKESFYIKSVYEVIISGLLLGS